MAILYGLRELHNYLPTAFIRCNSLIIVTMLNIFFPLIIELNTLLVYCSNFVGIFLLQSNIVILMKGVMIHMSKFAHFIMTHRKIVIFLTILITLFLGYSIKDIQIDPDILNYLPKSDPVVKLSQYIGKLYGGNLLAMVAMETDDIFTPSALKEMELLTKSLQQIDGITYVTSLTNILDIKENDGFIEIGTLVDLDYISENLNELQELKDYILEKDMYRDKFISTDATTALLICQLQNEIDKVKAAKTIKKQVEQLDLKANIYYGGLPFYLMEISDTIMRDLKALTPLVSILIIITLYLSFHSLIGVVFPILSVLISSVWTLGTMSLFGIPLTIISNTIPVILIAVGSAYSIHLINKYYEINVQGSLRERAEKTLHSVGLPIVLTAVTTIVGFISFIFGSYLTMIQQFGLFSALGVFFALVTSTTLVPVLLSLVRTKPLLKQKYKNTIYYRFTTRLSNWIYTNSILIVVIGLLIMSTSIAGIPRVQRKVDILDYFKPGSSIQLTEERIMKGKFGGSIPIQILVNGEILDPAVLVEMKKVQDFLATLPNVHNPFSIVDLIMELNAAMGEGRKIPEHKDKVANLWFFIEGEESVDQLVNRGKSEALIQATLIYAPMDQITGLVDQIEKFIADLDSPVCTFTQTGMHSIYKNLDHSLLRSQFQSLLLSLGLILAMVSLLLGSFRGGLIGLIPIIFTLSVIFGFMGYSKIPLDIATVLVGSISIGIGIDYSIHFINRFQQEIKFSADSSDALVQTLQTTGRGIIINVLTHRRIFYFSLRRSCPLAALWGFSCTYNA